MTTEEMKKELETKGYIVKKRSNSSSGQKISNEIQRKVFCEHVQEKYGWSIYIRHLGYGSNNKIIRSEMMSYIKGQMMKTWAITKYIDIPDINVVINWGKEWIDNYISAHKNEWDEEEKKFKEEQERKMQEYLKYDRILQIAMRVIKKRREKIKMEKALDYVSK